MDEPEVIKFYKKFDPLDCDKKAEPSWLYLDKENRIQPTEFAIK